MSEGDGISDKSDDSGPSTSGPGISPCPTGIWQKRSSKLVQKVVQNWVQNGLRTSSNSETGVRARVVYLLLPCPTTPCLHYPVLHPLRVHTAVLILLPVSSMLHAVSAVSRENSLGSDAFLSLGREASSAEAAQSCLLSSEEPHGLSGLRKTRTDERLDRTG